MNHRRREDSGRRIVATVSMFVAVGGLLLLQTDQTGLEILGAVMLVVGGTCEVILSLNIFLRRIRRWLSR